MTPCALSNVLGQRVVQLHQFPGSRPCSREPAARRGEQLFVQHVWNTPPAVAISAIESITRMLQMVCGAEPINQRGRRLEVTGKRRKHRQTKYSCHVSGTVVAIIECLHHQDGSDSGKQSNNKCCRSNQFATWPGRRVGEPQEGKSSRQPKYFARFGLPRPVPSQSGLPACGMCRFVFWTACVNVVVLILICSPYL